MIVSHKHKFIFIKTYKTANSSVEIALSKYCGPNDILTPLTKQDELKRKEFGYRGAQNYFIPFKNYSLRDYMRALYQGKRLKFYNHVGADYVKRFMKPELWCEYFKFCFERNPWDKMVSWYYWTYKNEPRPSISEFLNSEEAQYIDGVNQYSDSSGILVDKVYFYEDMENAMLDFSKRLGLYEIPNLPRAKTKYRDRSKTYREVLSEEDKKLIESRFSKEIELFNYKW